MYGSFDKKKTTKTKNNNIKYKRRKDLEVEGISTVWLQIGCPGKKHFLFQSLYRQFQRLGRTNTKNQPSQMSRWKQILDKWELANSEGREIISVGDFNMDSISWDKKWEEIPSYGKTKQGFYHQLRDRILSTGTYKINTDYTRPSDQPGGRNTCIDHVYSMHPEKINSHSTHYSTFSDHAMLEINKRCKKIQNNKKYIKVRSMTNFN